MVSRSTFPLVHPLTKSWGEHKLQEYHQRKTVLCDKEKERHPPHHHHQGAHGASLPLSVITSSKFPIHLHAGFYSAGFEAVLLGRRGAARHIQTCTISNHRTWWGRTLAYVKFSFQSQAQIAPFHSHAPKHLHTEGFSSSKSCTSVT